MISHDVSSPPVGNPVPGVKSSGRGWRWLPAGTAAMLWLLLAGVAAVPAMHDFARARFRWMLDPQFHDWHVVRQGWEVRLAGVDPLAALDRPFNYPRVVLLGAYAGGTKLPVAVAGLGTAGVFLACLVWLLRPRSPGEAWWAAAMIASPPVWLMVERANLDAWALILVATGVAALARARATNASSWVGATLLTGAALIKLYPAVVLLGGAGWWRGARRAAVIGGLIVLALWAVVSIEEIALILRKTTRGLEPAYGRMIAGSRYYVDVLAPRLPGANGARVLRDLMEWSLAACVAGFTLAALAGWRRRRPIAATMIDERANAFFCSGALIYAGTFLLGSNWSYRLVFLLFCLPALWRAKEMPAARPWAGAGIAGIAVMMLAPFHLGLGWFWAREAVAWTLAGGLLAVAVAVIAAGRPSPREQLSVGRQSC